MNDFLVATAPVTAEHVLAVLRDSHRQQCQHDPDAIPHAVLSFETTIDDWRAACDLVDAYALGDALNEIWQITLTRAEWLAILEPAHVRTLRDVCDAIAAHARRPIVRPAQLLGSQCTTAGAFLAMRALLVRDGADARRVRPSTPLAELARGHGHTFLGPISQLAPGALPLVAIRTPIYHAALLVTLVGIALCFWRLAVGAPIAVLGYAGHWIAALWVLPSEVRFGELRTFGDLARVVAANVPSR